MKIAVTGTVGQVATSLIERGAAGGHDVAAIGRPDIDLAEPASVVRGLEAATPDVIVSAAAYTAVDKAETESSLAHAVNGVGARAVARAAKALGVPLIHISTDYVFDGNKQDAYVEEDVPNPQGAYGRTKLAGEIAVRESGCKHLILRTSWVYGVRGHNFMLTMLRLGRERDELRVVADQIGAPTWCRGFAEITAQILAQLHSPRMDAGQAEACSGTYHLTGGGETSWFGFASEIIGRGLPERNVRMLPITTDQYPLPAPRPANSRLSNQKLRDVFGLALPTWRVELANCLAEKA